MSAEFVITVRCPMCGHENKIRFGLESNRKRQLKLCDVDTGGCDDFFVVMLLAKVTAKTAVISDFLTEEEHAHDNSLRERE